MKYPSVLAFDKKIIPSDAYMYGKTWSKSNSEDKDCRALEIKTKTVRATKSSKGEAKPEETNIQTVDYCALSKEQDTLKLSFTLKFLGGLAQPSSCDVSEFKDSYFTAMNPENDANKTSIKESFELLGNRYAHNIANGRFLWRNLVGAESIEVQVKVLCDIDNPKKEGAYTFEDISRKGFDNKSSDITELGEKIAEALASEDGFLLLEINCFSKLGKNQDVYPSEEFVQNKGKLQEGGKSKELYKVDAIAAMHSQKIGNAIRTIDTWYPSFAEYNKPIAIEPFGSVTNFKEALRRKETNKDFYTLFETFVKNEALEEEDLHYVIAILIRGGVFGAKGE